MLLELLTLFRHLELAHRNSPFRRHTVTHFKTNVHDILRPIIKNFPKSAVDYKIQTTEL